MKRLKLSNLMMVVAAIMGGLVLTRAAEGTLIEFTFGGTINSIVGELPPAPWDGVMVGSEWSVSYIFSDQTPDEAPAPFEGQYRLDSATVTLNGAAQTTSFVMLNILLGPVDEYSLFIAKLPIGAGGGIVLEGIGALPTDELPTDLVLDDFGFLQQLEIIQSGGGYEIRGDISTFSSLIVPGPAGSILFCLFLFRRRRKRRVRPFEHAPHFTSVQGAPSCIIQNRCAPF